jgi:hypothetical protein
MWGYTDFSVPRWRFTRRFLRLRQDPGATAPQKAGWFAENAWAGHAVEDEVLLKRARARAGAKHPDFHCSVEIFTNAAMLEVETRGRMETVEPEGVVERVEQWSLHRDAGIADGTDEELEGVFYPHCGAE